MNLTSDCLLWMNQKRKCIRPLLVENAPVGSNYVRTKHNQMPSLQIVRIIKSTRSILSEGSL